jgi:hypothetical protein
VERAGWSTPHPRRKNSEGKIFVGYLPQKNILVPKVSEGANDGIACEHEKTNK